ncbi:MAG: magnesium and cobalt transport protein CorA [Candidatus Nanopelagicales bacterium]
MITSVFRYRNGAEVPVDSRCVSVDTPPWELEGLLTSLVREVATEAPDPGSFVWLKLANPSRHQMEMMQRLFDLPDLQVEDSLNGRQRPKVEIGNDRAFIVLKELRYTEEISAVDTGQVAVFLGPGFALSIRRGDAAPGSARDRLRSHLALTRYGPASVLYAVLDVLADGYLDIVQHLANDLEDLEDAVFSMKATDNASMVYNLKRENLEVKRAISPLISEARTLVREEHSEIPHELAPYFRDIGDHVLRANDLVESHDQLLMTMLMASTSQQDLRQNKDMRKISAWAAIIAVPTAIAGIYGMNFEDMPELHWSFGYPAVLIVMATICLVLYRQFKRSGWL